MKERIIFECEHCRKKRYMSKYQMHVHESICWYNPKNKACNTCEHADYAYNVRYCAVGFINVTTIPKVNCESWKLKSELEEDNEQLEDI